MIAITASNGAALNPWLNAALRTAAAARPPKLQKPFSEEMTGLPKAFSTKIPCALIATSKAPLHNPKRIPAATSAG